MTLPGIPEDVQRFVRDHIDSVEQVDVLLLLFRSAPREWTPVAVSRELRIDPVSAARRLDDFHAGGLLQVRAGDETLHYAYAPSSTDTTATIERLATVYAERRTTLIQFIFAAPVRDVRVFADAFRLRKKDPGSKEPR